MLTLVKKERVTEPEKLLRIFDQSCDFHQNLTSLCSALSPLVILPFCVIIFTLSMSLPKPPVFWILSDRSAILVLAVVGGFVASAGYMKLFGLFVTSITGNLVVATTSGFYSDGSVVARVLVMAVFATGAVLTKILSFRLKYKLKANIWNTAILLFACEAIVLLLSIVFGVYIQFWRSGFDRLDSWQTYVQASLLAFAMGIHNAASLEVIENCPATTMVTSTFVKIAMSAADTAQYYVSLKGCADYDYNRGEATIEEKFLNARATFCSNFILLVFFVLGAIIGAISVLYIGFWCLFAPFLLILIIIASVQLCKTRRNQQGNQATVDAITVIADAV